MLSAGVVCITDVSEIAPILGFNVYNPDKHIITKLELPCLQLPPRRLHARCRLISPSSHVPGHNLLAAQKKFGYDKPAALIPSF